MQDVQVRYGEKTILGGWGITTSDDQVIRQSDFQKGLCWDVMRGERWGVFGPNGSGKTTLISLICSDHPLSYSLPIKIFGRARLPEVGKPGISIFDIQARIGQSSPEIHAFFPRNVSVRRVVENAWSDTFLGVPRLNHKNKLVVDACLRWFEAELNSSYGSRPGGTSNRPDTNSATLSSTGWSDSHRFGEMPFSAQRVALFLRAIVKGPELIVLDEAFSGMDEHVRNKCMLFLTPGVTRTLGVNDNTFVDPHSITMTEKGVFVHPLFGGLRDDQTLICVSHVKEEVPRIVKRWMCLPESGTSCPVRFGSFEKPLDEDPDQWEEIWAA